MLFIIRKPLPNKLMIGDVYFPNSDVRKLISHDQRPVAGSIGGLYKPYNPCIKHIIPNTNIAFLNFSGGVFSSFIRRTVLFRLRTGKN